MSPTLAASDRTIIPVYEGILVLLTIKVRTYDQEIDEDERMIMILT